LYALDYEHYPTGGGTSWLWLNLGDDIFKDPKEGGQAPYHVYQFAAASGFFHELPMIKSLGILKRRKCGDVPKDPFNV